MVMAFGTVSLPGLVLVCDGRSYSRASPTAPAADAVPAARAAIGNALCPMWG